MSVSTSSFRTKVSVGSNPWATEPVKHNLATICERYGGGGHPRVGAISFEIGAADKARDGGAGDPAGAGDLRLSVYLTGGRRKLASTCILALIGFPMRSRLGDRSIARAASRAAGTNSGFPFNQFQFLPLARRHQ